MNARPVPPTGSLVGWLSVLGRRRCYGIVLSADRATAEWWCLQLQHPWRRLKVDPDEVAVLAGPDALNDALHRLAVDADPQGEL